MLQNLITPGIVFGLASMVGWGAGDLVAAMLSRKIGNLRALLWVTIFSDIFIVFYLLLARTPFNLSLRAFLLTVTGGLLHTIAGLSFFHGLKVGKVSLVAAISSSWSLILVLSAGFFLGEKLTMTQVLAVSLIILGGILVSIEIRELLSFSKISLVDPGLPYAFIAMFSWGIGWIFFNQAVKQVSWIAPNIILASSVIFILITYSVISKRSIKPPNSQKDWASAAFIGLAHIIGYISYSVGIEKYLTSLVAPVAAAYPLVTIILARLFLRERINDTQTFGVLSVIIGIVLLSCPLK